MAQATATPRNSCPAHEARSRVAAYGRRELPLSLGAQLAVDITLRCALTADGTAQPGAARIDGAVCTRAREDARGRSRLVVVDLETAGSSCKVWQPSGSVMLNLLCTIPPHWLGGDGGLGAFSVMRSFLHQFAGGHAHSVACQAEPTGGP